MMNLIHMMDQVKKHPDFSKAGMVLCHNGIVRETSRNGKEVTGLRVKVDYDRLDAVLSEQKKKQGIVEILVAIDDTKDLGVGDDVMYIVVAGDVRENVINTLTETLNRVKSEVTSKTEFFK